MQQTDRDEVARFIEEHWHGPAIAVHGELIYPHEHEGWIERVDGRIAGLLTYRFGEQGMELLTMNSVQQRMGIGSSLMLQAIETARERACPRIWLITTNDNLPAVGFYQRLGFRVVQVHVGAADRSRELKPAIPLVGLRGIEIHDEWEMELLVDPYL
jgi:GNAT superfamily N-acetyltransferase